ncbi:MAG TPA: hypothetical protein VGG64_24650 [Pirellulales bacterium]|jgi:hypothetical protein
MLRNTSAPRFRYLRFSLGTLSVFIAATSACLGWLAFERSGAQARRELARSLDDKGLRYGVSFSPSGLYPHAAPPWPLRLLGDKSPEYGDSVIVSGHSPPQTADGVLARMAPLTQLHSISLSEQITDAGVASLAAFPGLRDLDFVGGLVTDAGFARLGTTASLESLEIRGRSHEISLALGAAVSHLANLRSLELGDRGADPWNRRTPIAPGALAGLPGLQRLQYLGLGGTEATDRDLRYVAAIPRLRSLVVRCTLITDTGLEALASNTSIERITLCFTLADDAGMRSLGRLGNLTDIDLSETRVGDAGLAELAGLTNVKWLNLSGTRITDAALATISKFTKLERLDLSCTEVTDPGLAQLSQLKSLLDLNLASTRITDAALAHLRTLTALSVLNISCEGVTDAAAASTRAALPRCQVQHVQVFRSHFGPRRWDGMGGGF